MTEPTDQLERNGYLILPQVISPELCTLLSDYARLKASVHPKVRKGNDPLAHIHREYGDPLMETLLDKLTPEVERATGLAMWPTLSFYYTYQNGNVLAKHKDRSSCQWVAGLCIGVDEAHQKAVGTWPLYIEHHGKERVVAVQPGDLAIFKGSETTHWREPFTGEWFVSAIFGYVEQQGPYAFQKFDQRKGLGYPHVGMFHWGYGCLKNQLDSYRKRMLTHLCFRE